MSTAINVGKARAVVSRVTPPDDQTLIWHRQTNPTVNPDIGILYVYDWNINEWTPLKETLNSQQRDVFTVTANGQTQFTLTETPIKAELSRVNTIPGALLEYQEHYTFAGNIMTLDLPYSLEIGEKVIVTYYF